ncbi:type 2 lanthipeptide synthetase LanM [Ktedonosporobacter rubrisoli]|nr:type 2 lanthipeptide synthetase LanM [Ktedonosporobacter rubrisoli]
METDPIFPLEDTSSGIEGVRWYQATTLTERIASLPLEERLHFLKSQEITEQALKKLKRWKEQKPFKKGRLFSDRLAMDALSEQELCALLAEPGEALYTRLSQREPPDWLVALKQALATEVSPTTMRRFFTDVEPERGAYRILYPFYPLLQGGVKRLQKLIRELFEQYHHLPFEPESLLSLFLPHLFRQWIARLNRAVVLEMHIARLRGLLLGETPEERFQSYIERLSQPEHLLNFLEEYCVLARQLMITLDLWVEGRIEFLRHLCQDWEEILTTFFLEQNPGQLTEVQAEVGDLHRHGRSVMILTFRSGWQLVYKPRSLSIDIHFQEVLSWLNTYGNHPSFRPLKLINYGTHGWAECVSAAACSSEEEVISFYERQGGYLALLYVLEASDFHYENIIASGEHPFLIDLEALFHPRVSKESITALQRPAQQALDHSVMRIALLPQRFWSNDASKGVDISGLGNPEGQLSPRPVPRWEGLGTDEMKVIREQVKLQGGKNCPKLAGKYVQASEYIECIERGFVAIYRLLIEHREIFLAKILPRFAHDEIRFVARPTSSYGHLLTESFHPNNLRDALRQERLFDRLWMAVEFQPSLQRLIPAERADLLRGDIPLFTTTPSSRDLFSSEGKSIPRFFPESSISQARKLLTQLNEEDLQRQICLIRAAFASTIDDFTAQPDHSTRPSGS